jgi:hypothetical protein
VALGRFSFGFLAAFLAVSLLLGTLLSVAALALEERGFRRHARGRDVARLLAFSLVENLGYRQLVDVWRLVGLVDVLRGRKDWGSQQRRGFGVRAASG